MIRSVILLGLLAAGAFGYPLAIEKADTACAALEARMLGLAPAGVAAGATALLGSVGMSGGAIMEDMAKRKYPTLPPAVGCTVTYWLTLMGEAAGKRSHGA